MKLHCSKFEQSIFYLMEYSSLINPIGKNCMCEKIAVMVCQKKGQKVTSHYKVKSNKSHWNLRISFFYEKSIS